MPASISALPDEVLCRISGGLTLTERWVALPPDKRGGCALPGQRPPRYRRGRLTGALLPMVLCGWRGCFANCYPISLLTHTCRLAPICRHTAAPRVCRRWRQLVQSEPLLQVVSLSFDSFDSPQHLPRLRSFCEWMQLQASQHVQKLSLSLGPSREEDAEESAPLLAAAVAACGASGALAGLQLSITPAAPSFSCSSWVAALRSLRRLAISTDAAMTMPGSLLSLSALQELRLLGNDLQLPPAARLPDSLTLLSLGFLSGDSLPSQACCPPARCCWLRGSCGSLNGCCAVAAPIWFVASCCRHLPPAHTPC